LYTAGRKLLILYPRNTTTKSLLPQTREVWGVFLALRTYPILPSPFFRISFCYPLKLMLPVCQPLPVSAKPRASDGPEWVFELKYDGFRALAYIEHGQCRLVSRSLVISCANPTRWRSNSGGEIACVDAKGQPRFNDLLFRRKEPRFFAFDLLHLNGTNCLRDSLAQRKLALRQLPNSGKRQQRSTADHCGNARNSTLQPSLRT
jgi:hypothetical protein